MLILLAGHAFGQAVPSVVWPVRPALPNLPAGHKVFVVADPEGQYEPASHVVQVVPSRWYSPQSHGQRPVTPG